MNLGIIGGGSWGSALAQKFSSNFSKVIIYARDKKVVEEINLQHKNIKFFPNIIFQKNISSTLNINDLYNCDIIFISIPTQNIRDALLHINNINPKTIFVICAKGLEITSTKFISQVLQDVGINENNIAVLSGPSFSTDLIQNLPTLFVVATSNIDLSKYLANLLKVKNIKLYFSDDIIGAQIGGAIKNIIAIGCGVVMGANFGQNALAGLLSRGLKEMCNFGNHFKAKIETIYGVSGFGDLVLTATSMQSRNFALGVEIGTNGRYISNLLNNQKGIAEGYYSVKALKSIIDLYKISMPICEEVYSICYQGKLVSDSLESLMNREQVKE